MFIMASPPRARPTRLPRLRMRDELLKVSACSSFKAVADPTAAPSVSSHTSRGSLCWRTCMRPCRTLPAQPLACLLALGLARSLQCQSSGPVL